jgi:hydrogenase maturation protease
VQVIEAGQSPLPASTDPGPAGSHGFGLASSLELARALGCLPPRVVVVGIVGTCFTVGAPLSEPVARAVPLGVEAVLRILAQAPVGSSPQQTASGRGIGRDDPNATRREVPHVH